MQRLPPRGISQVSYVRISSAPSGLSTPSREMNLTFDPNVHLRQGRRKPWRFYFRSGSREQRNHFHEGGNRVACSSFHLSFLCRYRFVLSICRAVSLWPGDFYPFSNAVWRLIWFNWLKCFVGFHVARVRMGEVMNMCDFVAIWLIICSVIIVYELFSFSFWIVDSYLQRRFYF